MNNKFSMLFLLGVCVAGFVSAQPQEGSGNCGENSVFTSCGSACPPTCNLGNTAVVCPQVCVVGCQCIGGYLLNDLGNCVLPEDC